MRVIRPCAVSPPVVEQLLGDASEVIDRLQAARDEFGLSQIIGWFDQGSMLARDEVERTMRRFADQVTPKLAAG